MATSLDTSRREDIARQYVADVFTGSNAERARDYFTADIAWHGGALGTVTGVDTVVPVLGGFIGALSDIQATVQDTIASNDLVALRLVVTATHTGNLLGVPATGRPIRRPSPAGRSSSTRRSGPAGPPSGGPADA